MNNLSEQFLSASLDEIMRGFTYDAAEEAYLCLLCGKTFMKGYVYQDGHLFCEAEKYVALHVEREHPPLFDYLLGLDRKHTGLTEHTKTLLRLFYEGCSDGAIVARLGGGSTSTIRNHRFVLREREKEAKVFLAIMGLLSRRQAQRKRLIPVHQAAAAVDERFAITEEERERILSACFKDGLDGPLARFPRKEKWKIAVLTHVVEKFDRGRHYAEKEVNGILETVLDDYVTLRRYLVEYGFLDRDVDGGRYWVKV